jgi:hypothetical protein
MKSQMIRVISSPSISTTGFATWILAMVLCLMGANIRPDEGIKKQQFNILNCCVGFITKNVFKTGV